METETVLATWKDENLTSYNEDFQDSKEKISLVEVNEFLARRKMKQRNSDYRNRISTSTDEGSSKAYSYKCCLDDPLVESVLRSPSDAWSKPQSLPSDNICVRSMSIDFSVTESLSKLEAAAFAAILRESIDALDILKTTIRKCETPMEKSNIQAYVPKRIIMRKKGSCLPEDERKLIFGEEADYLPVVKSLTDKLLDDRDLVYNVFHKIVCELESKSSYDWLKYEINTIAESKEKEYNLEVNLKIWLDLKEQLLISRETCEKEFEIQKNKYLEETKKIAAEIDASYCKNNEKLDYIERWESSKLEQHILRLSLQEESILSEIKELEKAKEADAIVSNEIQSYAKSEILFCEQEIASWTSKYHEELERYLQETTDLQNKIEETQEFLENSRKIQKERQVVIDQYLEVKKKEQEEIEYWAAVNKNATLIQSIWRGYMVRHKLGPYKDIGKGVPKKKKLKKSKKKVRKSSG